MSHDRSNGGVEGNAVSDHPQISVTAPSSSSNPSATNLVAGQTDPLFATWDVFLFSRATGQVSLVSHTPGRSSTVGNSHSGSSVISADGAFVAFSSAAGNLVAGQSDANGADEVILFSRATGALTLVSHAATSTTTTSNSWSREPAISARGTFVAF